MAKNPGERYQTAQQLADDLRAFLENRSIKAKPPTIIERAKKWSRRHKPLVWSAGLSTAALVLVSLGVLASSNMAISRERNDKANALNERTAALARAESNFNMVLSVIDRLFDRVGNEKLAEVPQLDQLRKEVLDDALGFYEKLLAENPDDRQVQFATARANVRVAMMRIEFANEALGGRRKAIPQCDEAIGILDKLLPTEPNNPAFRYELATALKQRRWCINCGIRSERRAVDLFQGLVDEFPTEPKYVNGLVESLWAWYAEHRYGRSRLEAAPIAERMFRLTASPYLEKRLVAQVYATIAQLREREGRLDEAEAACREAIRIYHLGLEERPTYGRGLEHLIYDSGPLANLLARRGKPADAEEILRDAVRIGETARSNFPAMSNMQVDYHLAVKGLVTFLRTRGRTQEAVDILAGMSMRNAYDFSNRADFYEPLNRPELTMSDRQTALDMYSKQIEQDSTDTYALYRRGELFLKMKQFDKARDDFNRAIECGANAPQLFLQRAETNMALKRSDEALKDFAAAVELDPSDFGTLHSRFHSYSDHKLYDKALSDVNRLLEIAPDGSVFLKHRAAVYHQLKQYDKALTDIDRAIFLEPGEAIYWNLRGNIYGAIKQFGKALENYTKAIELDPNSNVAWSSRGLMYLSMNQYENAIADISEAIRLKPNISVHLRDRASAYRQMGQFEKAIDDLSAALHFRPKLGLSVSEVVLVIKDASAKSKLEDIQEQLDDLWNTHPGLEQQVHRSTLSQAAHAAAVEHRWEDAAREFNKLMVAAPVNDSNQEMRYLYYAPVLIRLNDLPPLDLLRHSALKAYSDTTTPRTAERIIRASLLAPPNQELLAELESMRSILLAADGGDIVPDNQQTWNCLAIALFDYRSGDWASSLAWCQKGQTGASLKFRDAMLHALRAMNHERLEQHDLARDELQKANDLIEANYYANKRSTTAWYDWEFASILRDEATELINRQPIK
jgi:tetratricopeptide (TPR) repeat protein